MSFNFSQEYTWLSFDRVVPEGQLHSMLADLAIILLDRQLSKSVCLDQLEDIVYDIENGEITKDQALEQITEISRNFLRDIDFGQYSTSFTVLTEYDSEYDDVEMAKEIAKFLFAKTRQSHFVWRSAAFDKHGAYSHQWIGFRKDGKIEMVCADEYFASQFALSVDKWGITPAGQR